MSLLSRLFLPLFLAFLAYLFLQQPHFSTITAGVSIFLFGMLALEDGFQRLSGGLLERFLQRSTDRLWKSVGFGVISTSIMQSSSLITVLAISFLSAGLISLTAGIGIIFGANLGTTTGAWLIAAFGLKIKLSTYAMPMLVFGIVLVFNRNRTLKGLGWVLAGIGFLFLGVQYMKEGFEAFRDSIDLASYALTGLKGLLIYCLVGIVATVIMQSSHATLVLIITALAAQQISYENALALAIGANVGTTVTAIIGSISTNIDGKRLAAAHLVFNLVTAAIAIVFMPAFLMAVTWLSGYLGIDSQNYTLQLAIFHTLFNLTGVLFMTPWIKSLVRLLEQMLRSPRAQSTRQPKYITDSALNSPQTAIEVVRLEAIHLYDSSLKIIANGLAWRKPEILGNRKLDELATQIRQPETQDFDDVYHRRVKHIYSALVEFVVHARKRHTGESAELLQYYLRAIRSLVSAIKHIKHFQKNLLIYLDSPNAHISHAYNELREHVAVMLRTIEQIKKTSDPPDETMLELDHLQLTMKDNEIQMSNEIESLIRRRAITPVMATSLMKDYEYTFDAINDLLVFSRILFGGHNVRKLITEDTMALDDQEMEDLIKTEP